MQPGPPSAPIRADDALAALDATAQAALVHRGEVSPDELVRAACARIESLDGALGAVAVRTFEAALAESARAPRDAPFAGVPFLMKDVGARQAGRPYYAGNRALRAADHRASADTVLGARFRALGLAAVGNSTTPEFALQSNTWPLATGPARNPFDLARSAGGSSGGACAAVAAGLVPVAHASDGAGSIRIPAAWCGLVGLKPSRDRIAWRHFGAARADVEFVVARSLRDTAAFLDALRPSERAAQEPGRFAAAACAERAAAAKRLRVAFTTRAPGGFEVDVACARAVEWTARALAARGHAVDEGAPPSLYDHAERQVYGAILGNDEYRGCLDELAERLGRAVGPDDVEPFLWELAHLADEPLAERVVADARAWVEGWSQVTAAWFEEVDALVTPTVVEPAPPLAHLDPTALAPLALLERMVPHMAFTEPWNATGQPAITLPLAQTREGLPVGVQIVAAPRREETLLALAAELLG